MATPLTSVGAKLTVEPVMPLSVAEIFEVPVATPVASPAVVMVATEVVAEAQVTCALRSQRM